MQTKVDLIHFRRATESDLAQIADLFARNNYGIRRLEWLRWKYFENPDGCARIYVAEDEGKGIVGLTARLPRKYRGKDGKEFQVFQNVDMFMAPEYRRRGIYGKLSHHAKLERDYFLMGFPNENSRRVNELDHVIPLKDWIFPVTPSQLKRLKPLKAIGAVSDGLSWIYARMWLGVRPKDIEMKSIKTFDKDYQVTSDMIHGVRCAAYLNWRFITNPMHRYHPFEFVEHEASIGYCVFALSGGAAEIYDLICAKRPRECLQLLWEHCRLRKITHLNFRGANLKLGPLGFIRRRSSEECITSDIPDGRPVPEGPWLLTLADRDV